MLKVSCDTLIFYPVSQKQIAISELIIIIIIIGATGAISKTFRKYVSNIPGNHEVKELQKTAILGTAHILRKVLM